MRRWIGSLLIALALVGAGCGPTATPEPTPTSVPSPTAPPAATPTPAPPPQLTPEQIRSIALSSVLIEALTQERGELLPAWWGSGTILTPDGLILTNAHVVLGADALVVSLVSRTDQPPVPSYYAEVTAINSILDLALVQITTDLDGNAVVRSQLRLPAVARGDSNVLELGQDVHVFGYPGVGGETLTFTQGTVSGFESEDLGGGPERIWIKTDAEIAPGNSGGTAVDDRGFLVGVPTMVFTDATAGRISRLRPINLMSYLTSQLPPRIAEASVYEPNDDPATAYGPLEPGAAYSAYLHSGDVDFYFIQVERLAPIEIDLTGIPPDVDYDLYLLDADLAELGLSVSETPSEHISYRPSATGTYYIVVAPWRGHSLEQPYLLQTVFNGEGAPPVIPEPGGVTVQGRLVDANTGQGIAGAIMALLRPGVTGEQFIEEDLDPELIQVESTADGQGLFVLVDVPRGQTYAGVVITEATIFWQNNWIAIEVSGPGLLDVGDVVLGAS